MKNVLLALLCSISSFTHAQTWQHLLSSPTGGIGGSNSHGIRVIDDTVFVSSAMVVPIIPDNNPDTILYRTRAMLSKHSLLNGESIDFKLYGDNDNSFTYFNFAHSGFNQLYNTPDSLIYIARTIDGDVPLVSCDLLIIDKSLEVQTEIPIVPFPEDNLFYMKGTRLDQDGNIFVYGSRTGTFTLEEEGEPNTMLIKFSPDGEELWKRSYDDSYSIESIHLHSDGSIYLTAARWNSNPFWLAKLLIKADSLGNEIWRYNYGSFQETSISFVTEDENGNLIVAGDWNIGYSDADSWHEKWFHIMRIENSEEEFDLIEEKMYGYSIDGTFAYGLDKTQDGGYIGWGRTGVADYSVEPWVPGAVPVKRGYIIKLDENLDSLWMRTYWKHDPNDGSQTGHAYQFGDVQELEEGGFVAAGWARRMVQGQGIREDSWICRIDEYGCIEPGCHLVNVEEIVIGLENSMSAFPNPASDVVTIQFTHPEGSSLDDLLQNGELIFFDMQGREVYRTNTRSAGFGLTPTPLQGRGAHSLTLDISHLPAGLYSAQWVSGKQWLDSTKILVSK